MKLISKTIKYKLDSSSTMQIFFFYPKDIEKVFWKNYRLYRKSGNDTNIRRARGSCFLRHNHACVRKSICDAPLNNDTNDVYI